jgi:hypothetical protein
MNRKLASPRHGFPQIVYNMGKFPKQEIVWDIWVDLPEKIFLEICIFDRIL